MSGGIAPHNRAKIWKVGFFTLSGFNSLSRGLFFSFSDCFW